MNNYMASNINDLSKNSNFYQRKTPILIFVGIYFAVLLFIGMIIFSYSYMIDSKSQIVGDISINQNLVIGKNENISNLNKFKQIYTAKFIIDRKTFSKVDTSKKVVCIFTDVNGEYRKINGVISSHEDKGKDLVTARIYVYKYELKDHEIFYVKPNTACNFVVNLEKERLITYTINKIF